MCRLFSCISCSRDVIQKTREKKVFNIFKRKIRIKKNWVQKDTRKNCQRIMKKEEKKMTMKKKKKRNTTFLTKRQQNLCIKMHTHVDFPVDSLIYIYFSLRSPLLTSFALRKTFILQPYTDTPVFHSSWIVSTLLSCK